MSDLISRQVAIDGKISIQLANGVEIYSDEAVPVEYLKRLPSAQPEIIRCKDCRYNNDCEIQYSAQSGDEFFCGCAERKDNG